jgi:hypothetical protein
VFPTNDSPKWFNVLRHYCTLLLHPALFMPRHLWRVFLYSDKVGIPEKREWGAHLVVDIDEGLHVGVVV